MLNDMVKDKDKKIDWKYNLSEYWGALRNYKKLALILVFLVFVVELTHIIPSFLFKKLVDDGTLFTEGSLGLEEFGFILIVIAGLYILGNLVQVVAFWFRDKLIPKLEVNIMTDLKMKYFKHIVGLDHSFHSSHKTGSLISKMNRGVSSVERITDIVIYDFMQMAFQLVIIGASIAYFDITASLVVVGTLVVFILFSVLYQKIRNPLKMKANASDDSEKAGLSDVFTNIDSIKYFGKENYIYKYFNKLAKKTETSNYDFWSSSAWLVSGQISIIVIGMVVLMGFPLSRFLAGTLTLGEIVFIYTAYRGLMGPMWSFVYGLEGFNRSVVDFQSLFDYGKIESKVQDKTGARKMNVKKGEIEFRDIDFAYKKKKVFEDFDLVIPAKNKVAFVGHSGCGKSTLVNLLYRFYDVQKGAVMIDGEDVRDFGQESLRGGMSIVPQECVLFDDTIWSNIKFSRPSASSEDVWKAIRFAQLDKVIDGMDKKEKTIVGERGVKLSGGEKQRVSIARALLADKKILVLDEATSALDSETEFEIQKSLGKLMKGRTSIIIAHRLSTIMHADLIVVMKKGEIVEMGTHGALLRRKKEYYRLWKLQKGGYIK